MTDKRPEDKVKDIQMVVMYSRIGKSISPEHDDLRFAEQEDAMLKFCQEHNLEVKSKYREIAPGTLDLWSRPILENAVNDIRWSKKEKSVLLVSRADRLSKVSYLSSILLENYSPKFLVVSTGLRIERLITQIQIACAEEEFRLKYGELYRTSEQGFKEFSKRHRGRLDLCFKSGMTAKEIADENELYSLPLPYDWHWTEDTIHRIMELTDKL